MRKIRGFPGGFDRFRGANVSWHGHCNREVHMENPMMTSVGPVPEQNESCEWLTAHGDYLFNLAVGQVRDHLVAEDLVQETFLAALKARNRFSGRSSDRTWLVGILRHKIYDHLRRVCRERAVQTDHSVIRADQE